MSNRGNPVFLTQQLLLTSTVRFTRSSESLQQRKCLEFVYMALTKELVIWIAERLIERGSEVTSLELQGSPLSLEFAEIILDAICNENCALKYLNISCTGLCRAVLPKLETALLHQHCKLEVLVMRSNFASVGVIDTQRFSRVLANKQCKLKYCVNDMVGCAVRNGEKVPARRRNTVWSFATTWFSWCS